MLNKDELEETLTRVVNSNLRRVRHLMSDEEKAQKIYMICISGGGTDTCNLITHYWDLEKEILRKIQE